MSSSQSPEMVVAKKRGRPLGSKNRVHVSFLTIQGLCFIDDFLLELMADSRHGVSTLRKARSKSKANKTCAKRQRASCIKKQCVVKDRHKVHFLFLYVTDVFLAVP